MKENTEGVRVRITKVPLHALIYPPVLVGEILCMPKKWAELLIGYGCAEEMKDTLQAREYQRYFDKYTEMESNGWIGYMYDVICDMCGCAYWDGSEFNDNEEPSDYGCCVCWHIYERNEAGETYKQIAEHYKTSISRIGQIVRSVRKRVKWVAANLDEEVND